MPFEKFLKGIKLPNMTLGIFLKGLKRLNMALDKFQEGKTSKYDFGNISKGTKTSKYGLRKI
jgi:hypothetical protein